MRKTGFMLFLFCEDFIIWEKFHLYFEKRTFYESRVDFEESEFWGELYFNGQNVQIRLGGSEIKFFSDANDSKSRLLRAINSQKCFLN